MLSKILVTLDGSDLSEQALSYAQQIVPSTTELVLLTVVDVPDFPIYTVYPMPIATPDPDYSTVLNDMISNANEYLDKIANNLRLSGYRVKTVVKCGEPALCILEESKEQGIETIVMSTHGRSGLSKWLFGSVTQKVLSAMPCPVIVVPGMSKEATDEDLEVEEAEA